MRPLVAATPVQRLVVAFVQQIEEMKKAAVVKGHTVAYPLLRSVRLVILHSSRDPNLDERDGNRQVDATYGMDCE